MKRYELVVIGAGIAGLTAAYDALENGVKDILILEREDTYGGILNQCIHSGFQVNSEEMLTGPEVAEETKIKLDKFKYDIKFNSTVLEINEDKIIKYVSKNDGISRIKAKAIILATGCRERYTGNILIPTSKFTGVFTIANAHKLINIDGVLPGKNPVIIANNKWALILARRLEIEGGNVKGLIINNQSGYTLTEEDRKIIDGFSIDIYENTSLIEVTGKKRVGGIKLKNDITSEIKEIKCDSLMLSVGYYPEIGLVSNLNLEIDKELGTIKTKDFKTSKDGVFACGNVIYGNSCIEMKNITGYGIGKEIKNYFK